MLFVYVMVIDLLEREVKEVVEEEEDIGMEEGVIDTAKEIIIDLVLMMMLTGAATEAVTMIVVTEVATMIVATEVVTMIVIEVMVVIEDMAAGIEDLVVVEVEGDMEVIDMEIDMVTEMVVVVVAWENVPS